MKTMFVGIALAALTALVTVPHADAAPRGNDQHMYAHNHHRHPSGLGNGVHHFHTSPTGHRLHTKIHQGRVASVHVMDPRGVWIQVVQGAVVVQEGVQWVPFVYYDANLGVNVYVWMPQAWIIIL
jgi:hypothetical protein